MTSSRSDTPSIRSEASSTLSLNPDSMPSQSILDLVDVIKEQALTLEKHLQYNGLPRPSFDAQDAPFYPSPYSPEEAMDARAALITATRTLHDLVLGPAALLEDINANDVLAMQTIHRFKIYHCFDWNEIISYEELSDRCGLNVIDLKRLLRLAMTRRVFHEPRPGYVGHTASSRLLAENKRVRDFSGIICEERFPASAKSVDALVKYGHSRDPSQSGFSLANNTNLGLYEELNKHPARQERWHSAMSAMALQISFDFIVRTLPWSSYPRGTIVADVGGGNGTVSIGLAERLPHLQFIVQDTPETVAAVEPPVHLGSRIRYKSYDFFQPQNLYGASVYYFRNIFHNWPDEQCIRIFRNHVPVMRSRTKLLIDDFALHDPLTVSPFEERRKRNMDVTMLIYFGSRERTVAEWREILRLADPRFELTCVHRDPKQPNALLEISWKGS